MECLGVTKLPEGAEWVYELKLDGYRAQALCETDGVRLLSRNGNDLSKRFPETVAALAEAMIPPTAVDGELVALDAEGNPSFQALQGASQKTHVVFYAFDILSHAGESTQGLELRDRLSVLDSAFHPSSYAQLSANFPGPLKAFVEGVRGMGGEGVIAKRLDSLYETGKRSGAWRKMRLNLGQEFVIGGYTLGANGFDSVIVGYYRGDELVYVARVRAGFVPASRRDLFKHIEGLRVERCPFVNLPQASAGRWGQGLTAAKMKECTWVRPEVVAAFEFLEWTNADHVRHIKYVGLRNDKSARQVMREVTA